MNKTTVFKFLGLVSLFALAGPAASGEVEPGMLQIWRSPVEVTNAAELGKPQATLCVTPEGSNNAVTLIGHMPGDSGCRATQPQKLNSVTSTFNLTCNGGQVTGVATTTKNASRFVTSVVWRGDSSMTRSYVYGSRVSACK
jgi:hypothetical protein